METIIGLLFILLPVIFKFIEKRLQDSGNVAQTDTDDELDDLFDEEEDFYDVLEQSRAEAAAKPVAGPPAVPVPKPDKGRIKKKNVPILVEEQPKKKKEKIDPKKLVIYSEIMKPKYRD